MNIPESHQDLLRSNVKAFASIATIMKDGTPQVTPVWFDWDGKDILVNSAAGRLKDRNMRANPNVALSIVDPTNPYRYIQIRGKVTEITTEGAIDHIEKLSQKYTGHRYFEGEPTQVRVKYRISPEHVSVSG
jgi:PPOX class probable F420-dependent enzyme